MWFSAVLVFTITGSVVLSGSPWKTENDYYYDAVQPEEHQPTISTQPQQFIIQQGHPVELPCETQQLRDYTVVWRKGNQILWLLAKRSEQKVVRDERVTRRGTNLTISSVRATDAGEYTCEVSTKPPKAITHTLQVRVAPSAWPMNNRSVVTMKTGSQVVMGCNTEGWPTPHITWSIKGGGTLPPQHGDRLYIEKATREDSGVYVCTAENDIGQPASATIHLQIMHAPEVEAETQIIHSGPGYSATLGCFVKAIPTPMVKFYRQPGNVPVDPMRLILKVNVQKMYTLHFKRVLENDLSTYTCNATNFMGNASDTVILTGKPKPVRFFSDQLSDSSNNYTLLWDVESYSPILNYLLSYKNLTDAENEWVNITLPGTSSSSIFLAQSQTLTGLQSYSSYLVRVWARNQFGYSESNETFLFTTSPGDEEISADIQAEEALSISDETETLEKFDLIPTQETKHFDKASKDQASRLEQSVDMIEDLNTSEKTGSVTSGQMSSAGTPQVPRDKRVKLAALVTAISLSAFLL